MIRLLPLALLLAISLPVSAADSNSKIKWREYDDSVFAEAKRDHKFILLDLEAVWCHWCHVMDEETYRDPAVLKLLNSKYICVRVDQDARPDLSNKYEEYGWPATIIFNASGGEIVKRSGYINPARMTRLLNAIVKDPSPEDETDSSASSIPASDANSTSKSGAVSESTRATSLRLSDAARQELLEKHIAGNDAKYGAWGTYQKFLDFDSCEYAITRGLAGDAASKIRAIAALDGEMHLLDPAFGGIYQYSTDGDWSHPHFEKIMQTQAENLRLYALAFRLYDDPRYLTAAKEIARFLNQTLNAGDAFYTSQDADLVAGQHSAEYFSLSAAERLKLGMPRIDKHIYARENGWAINAMVELYLASADRFYLDRAVAVSKWIIAHRSLPGGGFAHGESDKAGPYLGDTLAMGRAFLTLYRATGDRQWLDRAQKSAQFIDNHFKAASGFNSSESGDSKLSTQPLLDENVLLARYANLLFYYGGEKKCKAMAEHALAYLTLPETARKRKIFVAGILLADDEINREPAHITVVGSKKDTQAAALFQAAAALPSPYMRIEWLDAAEGPLPHSEVELPQLSRPAAFYCADGRCSTPAYDVEALLRLFKRNLPRI